MKYSLITLITLLFTTAALAGVGEPHTSVSDSPSLKPDGTSARTFVNRGPNQTLRVRTEGLALTYQEGHLAPTWAELTTPGVTVGEQAVKLTLSPSFRLTDTGHLGIGTSLELQLSGVLAVNHSSHLGGFQGHRTVATLAPNSVVSLQYQRVAGKKGVESRLGPSVKLGSKMALWHGRGLDGSSDLTVLTGNLRF